jgi:A/G-specific adenine glycosylase
VVEKYTEFVTRFPTVHDLAKAPLSEVLKTWQGLGYNRRGKALHETGKILVGKYGGKVPRDKEALMTLPGIGAYTAGAIRAFAFNVPDVFIETNIRTVYLYFFFDGREQAVHDQEILTCIEETVDHDNPRDWYQALMDFGAHLKAAGVKLNTKSRHYTKQSAFEGSDRQIRGAVLRALSYNPRMTERALVTLTGADRGRLQAQLARLSKEGMIICEKNSWKLG